MGGLRAPFGHREHGATRPDAALRACLSDDTLRVVRNMDLEESQRNDIWVVISQLEAYAIGQVNEVLERLL